MSHHARARLARHGAMVTAAASLGLALAHEQPDDPVANWVLTDWMILVFLVGFLLPALIALVVAWRRGLFEDIEGPVKTFWLTPEPDFETPPWAWEEPPEWARKGSS